MLTTPPESGNHYLHIRGTSILEESFSEHSNLFKVDTTNPTSPTINSPTTWQNSNVSVTISDGSDSHSGVDRTEYRIDNGLWTVYNNTFSISESGETIIYAQTIDNAGNISETVSQTIKIDKVNPELSITPNTTSTTHEDVVLTAEATDEHSGVKRIQLPNNDWVEDDTARFNAIENGTYSFVVEDNAGNTTTESITIDNIDKTISFEKPIIDDFSDVTLGEDIQTVTANVSPVVIKDWTESAFNWNVRVSASQLKLVGESYYLPEGSMRLKAVSDINRVEGSGDVPGIKLDSTQSLDDGAVLVAGGIVNRGEFNVVFPNNALEILVDPTTAKPGKYESTITWDIVLAPM